MAGARVYVYAAHAIAHARTKMAGKMATLGKRVPMLELVFSMDMWCSLEVLADAMAVESPSDVRVSACV